MHNEDRFNFSYRFAENSDVKDLRKLMEASISNLLKSYLSEEQIEASFECMAHSGLSSITIRSSIDMSTLSDPG